MIKRIDFKNFDDNIYYDDEVETFYDSRFERIVSLKNVDDEFLKELGACESGHEVLCLLLIGSGYSMGKTAEEVLQDFYENDYVEASFGDTFAQANIDELEHNLDTMNESELIYTYNIVKIGDTLVKIGD